MLDWVKQDDLYVADLGDIKVELMSLCNNCAIEPTVKRYAIYICRTIDKGVLMTRYINIPIDSTEEQMFKQVNSYLGNVVSSTQYWLNLLINALVSC